MAILDLEYGKQLINSYDPDVSENSESEKMEMILQNSSYGHEYTALALRNAGFIERQKLQDQLDSYKNAYFNARKYLSEHEPDRLFNIEKNLIQQKTNIFSSYHA